MTMMTTITSKKKTEEENNNKDSSIQNFLKMMIIDFCFFFEKQVFSKYMCVCFFSIKNFPVFLNP